MMDQSPPASPANRLRRFIAQLTVVSVIATSFMLANASPASAAGTTLLQDSFTGPTVTSSAYDIGGSNFIPCLTANGTGTSVVPRCSPAPDSNGSGALRLTPAVGNRSGFMLYDHPLPTKAGLDIEFNFYQYGGDGADGISFFLADGSKTLSSPGGLGGSLGYHNRSNTEPGLNHALLGIGFDSYGNFGPETNNAGCPSAHVPGGRVLDSVAVRGPMGANQYSGYCLLGQPVVVPGGIDNTAATTRADATRSARIVIDPPQEADPQVRVYINGALYVSVPQPSILKTTPTFKFGWAASTGGSYNVHEINFLQVETVIPIQPELLVTAGGNVATTSGVAAAPTFTPSVDPAGGPESGPVTAQVSLPANVTFDETPHGTGWTCTTAGTAATCTHTPSTTLLPGTALPTITVPVTTSGSGLFPVTMTVDSPSNAQDPLSQATSTVTVAPVAKFVSEDGTAHATAPAPVHMTPPTPDGTGPFYYEIVTPPAAARGSATIDSSTGEITFTPEPNFSGHAPFEYRVRGADSVWSAPQLVRASIAPVAPNRTATTEAGVVVDIPVPSTPIGTGSFRYYLTNWPLPTQGTATIDQDTGLITFTPAAGFSGTLSFLYRVTDGYAHVSKSATVSITVQPRATTEAITLGLDATGNGVASSTAPTPNGTGPFVYTLVDQPASGSAVINTTTGAITYTAEPGESGTFLATYTVTDGSGTTSPMQTQPITVRPYTSPLTATTDSATSISVPAPTTIGTGPFTYSLVTSPSHGEASIDPSTGVISFDPEGHSGTFTFTYQAVDDNGVSSGPVTVTINSRPISPDLDLTSVASPTPADLDFVINPEGDGPFAFSIVNPLDPSEGTATVTPTGIVVTPAPGVSGTLTVTYTTSDGDGLTSETATLTVDVSPVAQTGTVTAQSDTTTMVPFPTPTGTGPFTYTIVSNIPAGEGTATVEGANVVIDIPSTFSGMTELSYTVTDASGLTSAVQTLTIEAPPATREYTPPSVPAGHGTTTPIVPISLPEPAGTGPFTWEILSGPDPLLGSAVIDPTTGELTFTGLPGVSGPVTIVYQVTDGAGLTTSQTLNFDIRPSSTPDSGTAPIATTTRGTDPVTIRPEAPVGSGPFTYRLDQIPAPEQGAVTIDPSTGEMVFTPTAGFTGTATFSYVVVDANGLESDPQTVTVDVLDAIVEQDPAPVTPSGPIASPARPTSPLPTGLAFSGVNANMGVLLGAAFVTVGVAISRLRRRLGEPAR